MHATCWKSSTDGDISAASLQALSLAAGWRPTQKIKTPTPPAQATLFGTSSSPCPHSLFLSPSTYWYLYLTSLLLLRHRHRHRHPVSFLITICSSPSTRTAQASHQQLTSFVFLSHASPPLSHRLWLIHLICPYNCCRLRPLLLRLAVPSMSSWAQRLSHGLHKR